MANRWLRLFQTFIADIRIQSKEMVSSDPRGVPLVLWESQRRFIHEVGKGLDDGIHQFNCLKSRQLGVTTVSLAIDVFWLAMHDGITAAMVTDSDANKAKNRAEITRYVQSFPEGYFGEGKFDIVSSNREMMTFSNGSTMRFLVAGTKKKSISWAEGTGYAMVHATEVAKYGDAEGLKSLLEGFAQTNPHRLLIMESTAMGYNHWKARYEAGQNDPLTQRSFFIGWWASDINRIEKTDSKYHMFGREAPNKAEREKIAAVKALYNWDISREQLCWIRWKEVDAGREQDLLQQNQPWTETDAFVSTGYSFFEVRTINKDLRKIDESNKAAEPFHSDGRSEYRYKGYRYIETTDFFRFGIERLEETPDNLPLVQLKVWEEPVEGGKYVIGFDVAYGEDDTSDGNAISVWRCYADCMVQVAEYATYNVDARYTAWVFFHLCAAYGDVMGNMEINGPGRIIMNEFQHLRQLLAAEMNQAKVRERQWEDAASQARWYLYHKPDTLGPGYVYNFSTTWSSKPGLMTNVKSCYAFQQLKIRSRKLLDEMALVKRDEEGRIGAPDSADSDEKDDRVMAMAFAALAWVEWRQKEMISNGDTFEKVTKLEAGEVHPQANRVNRLVYSWLARQVEAGDEPPPRGTEFQMRNGLV